MGIDVFTAAFLKKAGVSGSLLMIGRQALFGENADYEAQLGIEDFVPIRASSGGLAEGLLLHLGASSVSSLDRSDYEGATLLHDLNTPIPAEWRESFDVVFDGGSMEHIFNLPQALMNCMQLVRVGGMLHITVPANNQCGHGFYQISPELMYRALSPENGFVVQNAFLRMGNDATIPVKDPAGERTEIQTEGATLLYVSAKRTDRKEIFRRYPQQSDYVKAWAQAGRRPELEMHNGSV